MIPAELKVEFDKKAIKQLVEQKVDEQIHQTLWFVDINKLTELTCMSKRWLEDVILSDVRMRSIQIQKNRKRFWPYQKAMDTIFEIVQEWD